MSGLPLVPGEGAYLASAFNRELRTFTSTSAPAMVARAFASLISACMRSFLSWVISSDDSPLRAARAAGSSTALLFIYWSRPGPELRVDLDGIPADGRCRWIKPSLLTANGSGGILPETREAKCPKKGSGGLPLPDSRNSRMSVVREFAGECPERLVHPESFGEASHGARPVPPEPGSFGVGEVAISSACQMLLNNIEGRP